MSPDQRTTSFTTTREETPESVASYLRVDLGELLALNPKLEAGDPIAIGMRLELPATTRDEMHETDALAPKQVLTEGRRIFVKSVIALRTDPTRVAEAIAGDWSRWWSHANAHDGPHVRNRAVHPDGSVEFDFKPTNYFQLIAIGDFHLRVFRPVWSEDRKHARIDVVISGSFTAPLGTASITLHEAPGGGTELVDRWEGVEAGRRHWQSLAPRLSGTVHANIDKLPRVRSWAGIDELDASADVRGSDGHEPDGRASPCPATPKHSDRELAQRYWRRMDRELRVHGSRIWAQSRTWLAAPADRVRDLLLGDWRRWFRNSASTMLDRSDPRFIAGATSVHLFRPMGFTTMVTMRVAIGEPVLVSRPGRADAWRIATTLDGDVVGDTSYVIESTAPSGRTSDPGCTLRATWHGVRNVGLAPTWSVAWGHSLGEIGWLPFPMATGFPGLIDLAENGNCSCRGLVCAAQAAERVNRTDRRTTIAASKAGTP